MCIDFLVIHKALNDLKLWVYLSNLSSTFPSSQLFPSAFCSSHLNSYDGTSKLGSSFVSVVPRGSGGSQLSLSLATILGHSTQPLWDAACQRLDPHCGLALIPKIVSCRNFSKNHIISNCIYNFLHIFSFNTS